MHIAERLIIESRRFKVTRAFLCRGTSIHSVEYRDVFRICSSDRIVVWCHNVGSLGGSWLGQGGFDPRECYT